MAQKQTHAGEQLRRAAEGAAPAPDTFNQNYMGQIASASSPQWREGCCVLVCLLCTHTTTNCRSYITLVKHTHNPGLLRNMVK